MELFTVALLAIIGTQTSYLTYRQRHTTKLGKNSVLLDTSVLIDGRIVPIARSGLVSSRLIVPQSVVRELQFMADRADHDKRERARFGLEVIEKLQQLPHLTLDVVDDGKTNQHGVDEQLIVLAKTYHAKLCTIDYNLNKAARVQDIEVININELAHALRVVHLPGESIDVELVQPGQDRKQAVGYLDDGTMVVVDDSREFMGKTVNVQLTRVLQTAAGRMMFAKRSDVAKDRSATKPSVPKTPRAPKAAQQPDSARTNSTRPQPEVKKPRPAGQQRRRRPTAKKNPEASLVDLANKSDD